MLLAHTEPHNIITRPLLRPDNFWATTSTRPQGFRALSPIAHASCAKVCMARPRNNRTLNDA